MLLPQQHATPVLPRVQQLSRCHHGRLTTGTLGIQKRLCLLYCHRCFNDRAAAAAHCGLLYSAFYCPQHSDCDCALLSALAALASRLQQRPSHEDRSRRVSSTRCGFLNTLFLRCVTAPHDARQSASVAAYQLQSDSSSSIGYASEGPMPYGST
eukprot:TRINITY_DN209_c0_g1_i1.p2 TRINITY_DN209_c0_g1~~TRINITY_DN209_c0_g1_i1.p2  ORF type:complete len:154 (-),score=16.53 TRINITY_DN209_c0_g1_i1:215-676(-)